MSLRTFLIPVTDTGEACQSLNQFLRQVRVLSTERRFVDQGLQSFWSVVVDYLEAEPKTSHENVSSKYRNKVDYKEILTQEAFLTFSRLREFRKKLSQSEGVPVYAIFTNEQLAEIAKNQITTKAGLENVDGIGGARLSKYGEGLLNFLNSKSETDGKTGQSSV
jgi:superfamily II DNA helicase RecQ